MGAAVAPSAECPGLRPTPLSRDGNATAPWVREGWAGAPWLREALHHELDQEEAKDKGGDNAEDVLGLRIPAGQEGWRASVIWEVS